MDGQDIQDDTARDYETTNLRNYEDLEKRTNQANQIRQTWMDRINRMELQATTKAEKPQNARKSKDRTAGVNSVYMNPLLSKNRGILGDEVQKSGFDW